MLSIPGGSESFAATGDLDIRDDLTLTGAGQATTVIDGGALDRVFHILPDVNTVVEISGVTIQNGDPGAGSGGGIVSRGTLSLVDSTIRENVAGSNGGGILNTGGGVLTLTRSTVDGNTALTAGGILNDGGSLTLTASTVSGNRATGDTPNTGPGGGILNSTVLTLINSTVSGNTAGPGHTGGGIFNCGDSCGGATSVLTITNSTITGNSSARGGGINNDSGGAATLLNTIVAENTAPSGPDCSGTVSSLGNNLIGDATGCGFGSAAGDLAGTSSAPIDPAFGALQDNGGPTFTHALLAGSPAIDAGSGIVLNPPYSLTIDQRGQPRLLGAQVDIGAYEANTAVPVNPVGPSLVPRGATVDFEIQVEGVADLAAAQATLTYDPTLWTVAGVQLGVDFGGCLISFNDITPGSLVLALVCSDAHTGAPLTLWTVSLTAADVSQDQQTQLAVTQVTLGTLAEEEIPAEGTALDVTISAIVCGDVHPSGGGDGDVDVLDALRTLKLAVALVTPDAREQEAADVHPAVSEPAGDNDIDVLDALRVLKGAVGLVTITSCGGPTA